MRRKNSGSSTNLARTSHSSMRTMSRKVSIHEPEPSVAFDMTGTQSSKGEDQPNQQVLATLAHIADLNRANYDAFQNIEVEAVHNHIVGERECYNLDESSLFILSGSNRFRRGLFAVIDSTNFERFVLGVILFNSFTLILDAPEFQADALSDFLNYCEVVFLAIFTAEMVLKILALGFFVHPFSYLRSIWNVIDFVVVLMGFVSFLPGVGNFSVIRLFRILRPLRAVSRVPGLTVLITSIMDAIPGMLDVFLLLIFLLTMFSVLGVQLWEGTHDQRCYTVIKNVTKLVKGELGQGPCGDRSCPDNSTCDIHTEIFVEQPFSFDNFPSAMLFNFKIVSLDNWPDDMNGMQQGVGWSAWIYFFFLTLLGSYYTVNLILAVLSSNYQNAMLELKRKELFLKSKDTSHLTMHLSTTPEVRQESKLREYVRRFVEWNVTRNFIMLITILNLLVLAMDHYHIPPSVDYVLEQISLACGVVFAVEMVLKIFGLGMKKYFRDHYNLFDFTLVMIFFVEAIMKGAGQDSTGSSAFSALRAFRLARVVRMMQANPELKKLVSTIVQSVGKSMYLLILILLLVFIFSVLGVQLFNSMDTPVDKSSPATRASFQTLWESFITVFIVVTGENWAAIMKLTMNATHPAACVFFIVLFSIGNFGLLNLFVAILIDSFQSSYENDDDKDDDDDDDDDDDEASEEGETEQSGLTSGLLTEDESTTHPKNIPLRSAAKKSRVAPTEDLHLAPPAESTSAMDRIIRFFKKKLGRNKLSELEEDATLGQQAAALGIRGTSLGIFRETNRMRIMFARILQNPWTETFIMCLILANAITLGMDDPSVQDGSTLQQTINICDIVFTVLFAVEMVMKIIVMGLLRNQGAYLRDPWNRIDCFVVIISIVSFAFTSVRLLRSVRTVRLLSRLEASRKVILSLFAALPAISNVVLVVFFIFLIFGILGVQLFKGTFGECSDDTVLQRSDCFPPNRWVVHRLNFDDVIEAMVTLFVVAIGEMWSIVLYDAMDASQEDVALTKNARPLNSIFILSFVFVGCFFATNLFVGMLIEKFQEAKQRVDGVVDEGGNPLLTQQQLKWLQAMRIIQKAKIEPRPPKPRNFFRRMCYKMSVHPSDPQRSRDSFELFITVCILVNVLMLTLEHYNQPNSLEITLYASNIIFTVIFSLEAIIKTIALTPRVYIRNPWNRFDLMLVVLSLISFGSFGANTNAFRVMRLFRILRLVKKAQGLNMLFNTLIYSAPALGNIGLVLLIVFFIFGVLGVDLFGTVSTDNDGLSPYFNFQNLPYAMVTLYSISTTESWVSVYQAVSLTPDNSDCVGNQCGNGYALGYFFLFLIATNMIGLNLLVYIVVDNYFQVKQDSDPSFVHNFAVFEDLKRLWSHFDFRGQGTIRWESFAMLVRRLPSPVGLGDVDDVSDYALLCTLRNLDIPIRVGGFVTYNDCVAAVARYLFEIDIAELQTLPNVMGDETDMYTEYDPNAFVIAHAFAVRKISYLYKMLIRRRKTRREELVAPLRTEEPQVSMNNNDFRQVPGVIDSDPP